MQLNPCCLRFMIQIKINQMQFSSSFKVTIIKKHRLIYDQSITPLFLGYDFIWFISSYIYFHLIQWLNLKLNHCSNINIISKIILSFKSLVNVTHKHCTKVRVFVSRLQTKLFYNKYVKESGNWLYLYMTNLR